MRSGTPEPRPPLRTWSSSLPRDRPRESRVAVDDAVEELRDPLRRLGLEQVAGRAAANRGEQVLLGAGGREDHDLAPGRGLAEPGQRGEAVEAGHEEVEQDDVRLRLRRGRDRLLAVGRDPGELEAVRTQQRRERLAGERMVVDDENACCHVFLIGSDRSADKTHVRNQRTELQAWLWGEVVLSGLLAASLALLLTHPTLRTQYDRPQLLLVLETTHGACRASSSRCSRASASRSIGLAHRPAPRGRLPHLVALDGGLRDHSGARQRLRSTGPRPGRRLRGSIAGQGLIAVAPFVSGRSRLRDRALSRHGRSWRPSHSPPPGSSCAHTAVRCRR